MTKACPNCNQTNPPEAAFCLNCSRPLSPVPHIGGQPQAPWPQPSGGNAQAASSGAGQKAIIALGLAVAALLCCGPLTGIPAAIVGWMELSAIKEGRSPASGKWMSMVGLWGGLASSALHILFYALGVLSSLLSAASNPYGY